MEPKTFEETMDSFSEYWDTISKFELARQEAIVLILYMRWLDERYQFLPLPHSAIPVAESESA